MLKKISSILIVLILFNLCNSVETLAESEVNNHINASLLVGISDNSVLLDETIDDWMPDENLQNEIARALNKSVDNIEKDDMATLTTLTFTANTNFTTLKGLELATNLVILTANYCTFEDQDLSYISQLNSLTSLSLFQSGLTNVQFIEEGSFPQLERLVLTNNQISDISPLKNLSQLNNLILSNNSISDASALSELTNLTSIDLRGNMLTSGEFVKDLTQLTNLDLGQNRISDISPLASLTNLVNLNLRLNGISDLSPLENLTKLTSLDLYQNSIEDISALKQLVNLTSLSLQINRIKDISSLKELTSLTTLSLHTNQISDLTPIINLNRLTYLVVNRQTIQLPPLVIYGNSYTQSFLIPKAVDGSLVPLLPEGEGEYQADSHSIYWTDINPSSGTLKSTWDALININSVSANYSGTINQSYTTRENLESIEVRESELFVGDTWNPADNFVSATDKDGNSISFTESMVSSQVDTSQAGEYLITYTNGEATATAKVTVKEDETSLIVEDSTIIVGDSWNPADNFVSASDMLGNNVELADIEIIGEVDVNQVGEYLVTYINGQVSQQAKILVKADQTSVTVKDSSLYVGDSWSPVDNFVSAIDKYGDVVEFDQLVLSGIVDTNKVGKYEVIYSFNGVTAVANIEVIAGGNKDEDSKENDHSEVTNPGIDGPKIEDGDKKEVTLPKAGEQNHLMISLAGLMFLVLGLILLPKKFSE